MYTGNRELLKHILDEITFVLRYTAGIITSKLPVLKDHLEDILNG
jgi:hypothetical protein